MFSNFGLTFRNLNSPFRRRGGFVRVPMNRGLGNISGGGVGNEYVMNPSITVNEMAMPVPTGPTGPTGITGDTGAMGPTGPTGVFVPPPTNTALPVIMVHASSYVAGNGGGIITVNSLTPSTITLPTSPVGSVVTVVDSSGQATANPITIQSTATSTIGGESSYVIGVNWGSVTLASDGTKWLIIGNYS